MWERSLGSKKNKQSSFCAKIIFAQLVCKKCGRRRSLEINTYNCLNMHVWQTFSPNNYKILCTQWVVWDEKGALNVVVVIRVQRQLSIKQNKLLVGLRTLPTPSYIFACRQSLLLSCWGRVNNKSEMKKRSAGQKKCPRIGSVHQNETCLLSGVGHFAQT